MVPCGVRSVTCQPCARAVCGLRVRVITDRGGRHRKAPPHALPTTPSPPGPPRKPSRARTRQTPVHGFAPSRPPLPVAPLQYRSRYQAGSTHLQLAPYSAVIGSDEYHQNHKCFFIFLFDSNLNTDSFEYEYECSQI
jgi:hypothetical protein